VGVDLVKWIVDASIWRLPRYTMGEAVVTPRTKRAWWRPPVGDDRWVRPVWVCGVFFFVVFVECL
jgi:hypothetical protein